MGTDPRDLMGTWPKTHTCTNCKTELQYEEGDVIALSYIWRNIQMYGR